MIDLEEIRKIISPMDVAIRYLGHPDSRKGNKLWYKSPFRNERTASLLVDDKSFHDFGDNWDGDIFNFVQRYYQVNLLEAIKIIKSDFGLVNEHSCSKEYRDYLKQKRIEEQKAKEGLDKWFNDEFRCITKQLKQWEEIQKTAKKEVLALAYNNIARLEYIWEVFFEAVGNEEKKLKIYRSMR